MQKSLLGILVLAFFCISASVVLADPPANDDCTNATNAGTLVSDSTVQLSGSLIEATQDCMYNTSSEVWVSFTLTACMDITIDFCNDANSIYQNSDNLYGECPCDDMIIYSIQEYCQANYNPSKTWYSLEAGTYYYPIWSMTSANSYTINITGVDCPPIPANDDCSNAILVGEVTDLSYTTRGASFDGEGYCMDSPNIWYVYTPSFTGNIRVSLDADYNAKMAIYNGGDCSPIGDEIGCTSEPSLSFAATLGNQYLIEVGGTGSRAGSGFLTIEEAPESPSNDNCADADDAGTLQDGMSVQLTGTVAEATVDCPNLYDPEVWIMFTVSDYMHVTIDFCDSDPGLDMYSVAMGLYQDCPCGANNSYNEYNSCMNSNPSMTWQYLPAGTYYYPILNNYALQGEYTVNVVGVLSSTPPTGACCNNDSMACEVVDQYTCNRVLNGSWKGEGTDCGTYDEETGWSGCIDVEPTGACCIDGGTSCLDSVTMDDCFMVFFGEWRGDGTLCGEPDSITGIYQGCQQSGPPVGACCYEGGTNCADGITEYDCYELFFGEWKGEYSYCGSIDPETGIYFGCSQVTSGACCFNDGMNCEIAQSEQDCIDMFGGTWKGQGSNCGVFDDEEGWSGCYTPPTGACCIEGGMMCVDGMLEYDCIGGVYQGVWMGEGTTCIDADENHIADICEQPDTYDYLPGDANMSTGNWPPSTIGGDVTYLVNYFRGITTACMLDGFYASADANGSCSVTGADVTKLVSYFRGLDDLSFCPDYPTTWPPIPDTAPDGWPNCSSPVLSR